MRDVVPRMPKGYWYTLIDIGNVINMLMGGGFKSTYTRRRFRRIYLETTSPMRLKPPLKPNKSFTNNPSSLWNLNVGGIGIPKENGSLRPPEEKIGTSPSHHLTVPGGGASGLHGLQTALTLALSSSTASHESYQSTITADQATSAGREEIYEHGPSDQFFDRLAILVCRLFRGYS